MPRRRSRARLRDVPTGDGSCGSVYLRLWARGVGGSNSTARSTRDFAAKWSSDAREQRVPRPMTLHAVGSRAGELTLQHAQLPDLRNVELLPAMRCTALALTADLKTEQTLDAAPDA